MAENGILQIVREARIAGKSYYDIERLYKIPAPQAEAVMKAHYKSLGAIDPNEYRFLQMERLELLIGPLTQMVSMGNSKAAGDLSKILEQISELLGLNLQTAKVEVRVIQDAQIELLFKIINIMLKSMLDFVNEMADQYLSEKDRETFLAYLEDGWDERAALSFESSKRDVMTKAVVSFDG